MTERAPRRLFLPVLLLGAAAFGLGAGHLLDTRPVATTVEVTKYQIEVTGTDDKPRLLTRPNGNGSTDFTPGNDYALDLDADGLADVDAGVQFVDPTGVLAGTYSTATAPNIDVRRLSSAIGRPSPKVALAFVFTVYDDVKGTVLIRAGFDLREKGVSLPPRFVAALGGLETAYNPLEAVVRTTGPLMPTAVTPQNRTDTTYAGPLTLTVGVADRTGGTTMRFGFAPLPPNLRVKYERNAAGRHVVTYAHGPSTLPSAAAAPVDLHAEIVSTGAEPATIVADVRDLPSSLKVDYDPTGSVKDKASVGRLVLRTPAPLFGEDISTGAKPDAAPDVSATVTTVGKDGTTTNATAVIDDLASNIDATWYIPDDGCQDLRSNTNPHPCSPRATYTADGDGVGAAEVDVESFKDPAAPALPAFRPSERQFVDIASNLAGRTRFRARLENIRSASFTARPDGFEGKADVGRGDSPLEVHVATDERTADPDDDKARVDLHGTVDPLPRNVSISLTEESETTPLRFGYEQLGTTDADPGQPVDLRAHAEIRKTGPADRVDSADCGTPGVTCLDVDAHHVTPRITAVVTDQTALTDVDVRTVPGYVVTGGVRGPQPPMTFRVAVRAFNETEEEPLAADVSVRDVPRYLRARVLKKPDGRPSEVQLHNCDFRFDGSGCAPGTKGRIGAVTFDVRNTLRGDFPQPRGSAQSFIALVARGGAGKDVEHAVAGRLTSVDEVLFVDNGSVQGLRTKIGNGEPFSLSVDSRNVLDDPAKPETEWTRSDLVTDLRVAKLPLSLDLCVRPAGKAVTVPAAAAFTAKCEQAEPFAPDTKAGADATSFAYEADADFAIAGSVLTRAYNKPGAADDDTLRADLSVPVVPKSLAVHLATPYQPEKGATRPRTTDTRARIVAAPTTDQVTVDFAAERTLGDAVCADPRPTATATCVSGTLADIPPQFDLLFDGENPQPATRCGTVSRSLCITSTGTKPTTLSALTLSTVAPAKDDDGKVITSVSDAVVLTADKPITMPAGAKITGTLSLPKKGRGKPSIDISAQPRLTELAVTLKTYVVGDPLPKDPPKRIKDTPDLLIVQRGRAMRARIALPEFEAVGVRGVRAAGVTDPDTEFLPTQLVRVAFGSAGSPLRVYADLMPEEEPVPGVRVPGDRSLVDLHLSRVPDEFTVCVRPTGDARAAVAGEATWCDDPDGNRADDQQEGAFQLATRSPQPLDVDAFFRLVKSAGGDLTAGRLKVKGLPSLVRATFPLEGEDGDLDIGGYTPSAEVAGTAPDTWGAGDLTATSLGALSAVIATSDLAADDSGYTAGTEPYEPMRSTAAEIKAVASGQQLGVRTVGGETYVRGALDLAQRVRAYRTGLHSECPSIDGVRKPGYPQYPADARADTRYLCVRADFAAPAAGATNPIAFDFVKEDKGKRLALRDLLLDDAPRAVALTVTDTPVLDANGAFRPACRASGSAAGCAPPLVRLDHTGGATLSGTVEYGGTRDVTRLRDLTLPANVTGPAYGAAPTAAGWSDWGSDPKGVRAKIGAITRDGVSSPAVVAGLRIPVPASFTLDQVGSWSATARDPKQPGNPIAMKASDIKLRFAAHDSTGEPAANLGELAAALLVEDVTKRAPVSSPLFPGGALDLGAQRTSDLILVNSVGSTARGLPIPGEVDASVYLRTNKQTGQDFVQIDGRTSKPISAGVRLVPLASNSTPMRVDARLRNLPAYGAGDGPGFRVVAEILTPRDDKGCTIDAPGVCAEVKEIDVRADIDLAPVAGTPSRRVEAVIRHEGANNGVEVESYASVDPADTTHAPISVTGRLMLRELHLTVANTAKNPNNTSGVNVDFRANVTAPFGATKVSNFAVRQKGLRLHVVNNGNGLGEGAVTLGPHTIQALRLDGWFAPRVGPVPIPVAYFSYPFTPRDMAHAVDYGCRLLFPGGVSDTEAVSVQADDTREVFVNPLVDQTLVVVPNPVVGVPLYVGARAAIPHIFKAATCGGGEAPASFELIHRDGVNQQRGLHPGNPVPAAETPHHPVPGARSALPPAQAGGVTSGSTIDWAPGQGTHELCGTHHFRTLTIGSGVTLKARSISSSAAGPSGMQTCPDGQQGQLIITAETITVASGGRIVADAARAVSNSTGNSGASHYNKGGQGSSGTPAVVYGNREFAERETEMGFGGGGSAGGGLIVLHADTINLHGSVSADATGGYSGCGAGLEGKHLPGGGGGSGGGILVDAVTLNGAGSLSANGGPGGNGSGGGGGGAGGVIKVFNALGDGNPSQSTAGARGGFGCDGSAPGANKRGGDGLQGGDPGPQSVALALPRFWQNTETVEIPINAAVRDIGGRDYTVYVCGMYRTRDDVLDAPSGTPLRDLFYTAEVVTPINPCGLTKKQESGPWRVLGSKKFSGERIAYDPATGGPTVSALLGEGYWGIYTIVMRQRGATACEVDPYTCDLEYISSDEVDTIVGVDVSAPAAAVAVPRRTASRQVVGDVSAGDQAGLSGIESVECDYGAKGTWVPCPLGPVSWAADGEGPTSVKVRATDAAGNSSGERLATAVVDVTPPTATASLDGGLDAAKWHRTPLAATLRRPMADMDDVAPGGADSFVFQVDSGAVVTCTTTPCAVDLADVGPGAHRLLFAAVDAAGNRSPLPEKGCPPESCLIFRFDDEAPESALTLIGPRPVNGWYPERPYLAFSAVDQVGASGVGSIEYRLDGGAYKPFDPAAPPKLAEGVSSVCWRATDVAGNAETERCDASAAGIKVDGGAPVVAPFTESAAPHTSSGVYTGDFTVTVEATDSGAGIDPEHDSTADLCGPVPPRPTKLDPKVPSGLCVSVDGGDFAPQAAATAHVAITGAGRHVVRAFAVDVAGNRSPIREETYLVDPAKPAVRAHTLWGAPARGTWHRLQPRLVLRATDGPVGDVAGVATMQYRLGSSAAWTTYTGPVALPPGAVTVEYRATDRVDRVSDTGTLTGLRSDVSRPVVTAAAHTKSALTHTFTYRVSDAAGDAEPHVAPTAATARVYVFNERSQLVGVLPAAALTVPATGTVTATAQWTEVVTDPLAATPRYYFRVVVTDEAGHVSQSEESSAV